MRAALVRTYTSLTPEALDLGPRHPAATTWKKLVFALASFHAVVLVGAALLERLRAC